MWQRKPEMELDSLEWIKKLFSEPKINTNKLQSINTNILLNILVCGEKSLNGRKMFQQIVLVALNQRTCATCYTVAQGLIMSGQY